MLKQKSVEGEVKWHNIRKLRVAEALREDDRGCAERVSGRIGLRRGGAVKIS